MNNKNVSDLASKMDALLTSTRYRDLFEKRAQDMNDAKDSKKCSKCDCKVDECKCDSSMADDAGSLTDVLNADDSSSSSSSDEDTNKADDNSGDDWTKKEAQTYDVAIDSLLTASAALDALGYEDGSKYSLKIASLVVEAKKKELKKKEDKKKDMKKKDDKKDSKSKSSGSGSKSNSSSSKSKSAPKKK